MKLESAGMFGLGVPAFAGWASAADSLCAASEKVFFNCPIKDSAKLLSVCGRAGDYLQYRFGAHGKPELVFPTTKAGSLDKFQVAAEDVPSAFYESHQLRFLSGGAEYRVYAISEQEGGRDAPTESYGGVIVSGAGGRDLTIPCGAAPDNDLGALVRKFRSVHGGGPSSSDGITRASSEQCHAMPLNSGDSDFDPGSAEYRLAPLNDAWMLGLHDIPEHVDLEDGASVRALAKPQHGKLARDAKRSGQQAGWIYTPAPGFVGNDRAEFLVRGKAKSGKPVEFRLRYRLRVTPERRRTYLEQPEPPLLSVARAYCLIPTILLKYEGTP